MSPVIIRSSRDDKAFAQNRHVFGRRPKTRAAKPREKTSGVERLDLPCWMDLDLVSNLSIKPVLAILFTKLTQK